MNAVAAVRETVRRPVRQSANGAPAQRARARAERRLTRPSQVPVVYREMVDVLSATGEPLDSEPYLDQADMDAGLASDSRPTDAGLPGGVTTPAATPTADVGVPTPAGSAPGASAGVGTPTGSGAGLAVPVNLQQIVTSWTPGPDKYGFQLKFRVSSTSGAVADLQVQAPNLVWREYVTYSRNDFSHRITPPSPTILPPGGVGFSPSTTTVISSNLLEFNDARDTHWTPTGVVRREDFPPTGTHSFPAMMESSQVYQHSRDGMTWTTFAGPFTLRRTFDRAAGPPTSAGAYPDHFTTDMLGINAVTDAYKP
jgi:hypothetical protein